ncbi:hypothetical protein PF007_g29069 [Phytophthora fragariae]|uniref:Uncharacterized protein n=1 Tax=Phytophthora fragariae TaxID=53985 RepID=A0A6A3PW63_9STRA|nr:hypothetical protein PF007_g29069 [Phytophthora fragariae]
MLMTPTSLSPTLVVRQGPCRARGTGGDTPKVLIAGQDVVRQHDEVTCVDVVTVSGEQDEHEHAPDHQQRVKRRGQFGNAAPREVLAGRDDAGLADGKVAEGQQQQRVEAPDVHDLPVLRRRVSDPLDSLGNVATSSVAWEVSSELRVEWIKCSNVRHASMARLPACRRVHEGRKSPAVAAVAAGGGRFRLQLQRRHRNRNRRPNDQRHD